MKITKKCLRYLVPFTYQEDFSTLCVRIDTEKSDEWKRVYTGETSEIDLYSYIRNEFITERAKENSETMKMGITWRTVKKDNQSLCQLRFLDKAIDKKTDEFPTGLDFWISDMGLVIFRNQLGFFWYEIKTKKDLDSQALIRFQNIFKELNRSGSGLIWEKRKAQPEYGIISRKKVLNPNAKIPPEYFIPFSTGEWIAEKLSFLNPHFLPERKNAYKTLLLNSIRAAQKLEKIECSEENIIQRDFFESVPDKALLFTYSAFGESRDPVLINQEEKVLSYYLTNGYKQSYHCSEEACKQVYSPFSNVVWNVSQEGCAYLAWTDDSNRDFFNNTLLKKIETDYFTLYIKCLFQSYSLFLYSQKIQDSLSAVSEECLSSHNSKMVTELFGNINLFLTKTMATSVSHIAHQSNFYMYMKKRLHIAEDVSSITAGLDSLESLLREIQHREEVERWKEETQEEARRDLEEKERDVQMQRVMYLFSLLAIFSAFADGYAFVENFIPMENIQDIFQSVPAIIGYGAVSLVTIVISAMTIWYSVKFYISSRKSCRRSDRE